MQECIYAMPGDYFKNKPAIKKFTSLPPFYS